MSSTGRPTISAYIICKNEEQHIRRCLTSVEWCDEIIVVDSGSTDATLAISSGFTDKIFFRDWTGYGDQKNYALSLCNSDWVLGIDADEEVSLELKDSILKTILDLQNPISGYYILRVVKFLDRWWYKGNWYPEYRLRLGRKENFSWSSKPVHEKAYVTGKKGTLRGHLYHYTYGSISNQIKRINEYSSITANHKIQELKSRFDNKNQGNKISNFKLKLLIYKYCLNTVTRPIFRFIRFYLLKGSIVYGIAGLIVALNDSFYVYLKYAKIWENLDKQYLEQNQKHKTDKPSTL